MTLLLLQLLLANITAQVRLAARVTLLKQKLLPATDKRSAGDSCPHCRSKAQQHAL
jgi:hypothetical protein